MKPNYLLPLTVSLSRILTIPGQAQEQNPNILFIAVDDLNDWVGCPGENTQSVTPNFDKFPKSGVLFTNHHCPGGMQSLENSREDQHWPESIQGLRKKAEDVRKPSSRRHSLPTFPTTRVPGGRFGKDSTLLHQHQIVG